ncbi:hypothetical protein [Paenibacillus mucilaginosus]|uniref:Uncharacterized protein n=1 Tax=Paenibacillus mucilaginosus (strain KNP414) TaxID=1036673 RepID=F8FQG7_PAEMK|nr:hypothetical protein [Paenibacillus mucilaginosus]AEI39228.1 hypothetical protein KNP414_00624 [Paenibacillus mucilaginosus KNP414]MCG7217130.1 hypothetical protein [Paenibacillus mucilaginosus]WDM28237.1 hypothetical protein KCX80_02960 [Paenibacillus mucilaginosus]
MYTHNDIITMLSSKTSTVLVDKILYFEHQDYLYVIKNVSISDLSCMPRLYSANLFLVLESFYQTVALFRILSGLPESDFQIEMGDIAPKVSPGDTLGLEIRVVEKTNQKLKLEGRVIREGEILFKPTLVFNL